MDERRHQNHLRSIDAQRACRHVEPDDRGIQVWRSTDAYPKRMTMIRDDSKEHPQGILGLDGEKGIKPV